MDVSGQPHAPATLPYRKEPSVGWVSLRAGVDVREKRKSFVTARN
jgi:hypothetical protein